MFSCEECLRLLANKQGPPGPEEHQKKLFLVRQQAEKEKRDMKLAYE